MYTFSTTAVTKKTDEEVLRAVLITLTNIGFSIVNRDQTSAYLIGPGLKSTRQNPLLGASKIHLELEDQQLRLDAELGGVDSMRKFLMFFPWILGLVLGLLFGVVGGITFGRQFDVGFGVPWAQGWMWMVVAIAGATLPVSPWLFLSPMMSNMIRNRTQNALSTLARNAVQSSRTA